MKRILITDDLRLIKMTSGKIMDNDELFNIIRRFESRIPRIEDCINEAVGDTPIERYFLPLGIIEDMLLDIKAILRNNSNLQQAFTNTVKRLMDTKLSYLKFLRIFTDFGPNTPTYIAEMMKDVKGGE